MGQLRNVFARRQCHRASEHNSFAVT